MQENETDVGVLPHYSSVGYNLNSGIDGYVLNSL